MQQTIFYVSCADRRAIEVYALDRQSGEVQLRQRLNLAGSPEPIRISASRRVLYVGTLHENAVLAVGIDPTTGELSVLGSASAPGEPSYVSDDRGGKFVFVTSYADHNLGVFALDGQGRPAPVHQLERGLPRAHACLIDASNQWLLVPMLGADAIRVYRQDGAGRLTANDPELISVRAGSGPRHFVFSPDNRQVYCLNELDASIDQFDFDADTGRLTPTQSVSILPPGFTGKPWAAELRATPDGRFLYATERTASVIAAFAVEPPGQGLRLIAHYPTEAQPRGMGIDPTGQWLVAAGQLANRLTVFALDPASGRLSARSTQATGESPICIEFLGVPE